MSGHLIIVRGSAGVGKTAALRAVALGQEHLLSGVLAEAAGRGPIGTAVWNHADCWRHDQEGHMSSLIEASLERVGMALVDPCMLEDRLRDVPAGRVTWLYFIAPPWMVAGRRRARGLQDADLPCAREVETAAACHAGDGWDVRFVDTTDYPLREVSVEEALEIVTYRTGTIECADLDAQYQRALKVRGQWHGDPTPERIAFEQARLDAILPADCGGMTVLDVGGAEGGFCFEALERGATMALAVDAEETRLGVVKRVRTAAQLPVATCRMDVTQESLPLQPGRYGLGLLLNVLHHCPEPLPVFQEVLAACNRVVVETPFGIGDVPHKPGLEPYPNAWHLPPYWIERVGQQHGFTLTDIRMGPMHRTQRLIFDLEREHV